MTCVGGSAPSFTAEHQSSERLYSHVCAGLSLEDKPNLQKWVERNLARQAVIRGLNLPTPNKLLEEPEFHKDPEALQKAIDDVKKW